MTAVLAVSLEAEAAEVLAVALVAQEAQAVRAKLGFGRIR